MRLVLVRWSDSYGCSSSWTRTERPLAPKLMACESVGWLAYEGEDALVLVPHVADMGGEDEQGCGDMTIPRCAVLSIVELDHKAW